MQCIVFFLFVLLYSDASIHSGFVKDDVRYSSTSNLGAQGQLDPSLIKTCHVCSFVGDGQCSDDRKINCSMGYTCYKYDGTYNGQNYVEKGCLAYRYSANGCYVISRSEHEPFVGTKCFCDAANFCNVASPTRTNQFSLLLIVLLIISTIF